MTFVLPSLGWDDSFAVAYGADARPDDQPGRVTRVDRGVCTVLTAAGLVRASLAGTMLSTAVHDPESLPCAGDWVVVRRWPDDRLTVEAVLPRRSAVVRRTSDKDSTGQ